MRALGNAVELLKKKPSIFLLTFFIGGIVSLIEYLFMTIVYGFSMFKSGGSFFDDFINVIQFIVGAVIVPTTAVKIIIGLTFLVLAFSLLLALLFSGYFNVLHNAVEGKNRSTFKDFIVGIKKYFLRLIAVNLWTICCTILLVIYLFIASIPSAIVMDNSLNGNINLFAGFLLMLVTAVVLFFSFAFFRQYICFWYPSAVTYEKNHFKIAKKLSDSNFWSLLSRFLAFDITFLVFEAVYIVANFSLANQQVVGGVANTVLLIVNIVFKTLFYALMLGFIFSSFKECNDSYKNKSNLKLH